MRAPLPRCHSRFTAGVLYALYGRKRRPFEIQQSLGLKKRAARMPWLAAQFLATMVNAGVRHERRDPEEPVGCLLVVARRR